MLARLPLVVSFSPAGSLAGSAEGGTNLEFQQIFEGAHAESYNGGHDERSS